eukprot:8515036-Heterocapsa_arctica.AAC.1
MAPVPHATRRPAASQPAAVCRPQRRPLWAVELLILPPSPPQHGCARIQPRGEAAAIDSWRTPAP